MEFIFVDLRNVTMHIFSIILFGAVIADICIFIDDDNNENKNREDAKNMMLSLTW